MKILFLLFTFVATSSLLAQDLYVSDPQGFVVEGLNPNILTDLKDPRHEELQYSVVTHTVSITGEGEQQSLQEDIMSFQCDVTLENVFMLASGQWHDLPPWKEGTHGVITDGQPFLIVGDVPWLIHPSGFWFSSPCDSCSFTYSSSGTIDSLSFNSIEMSGLIDPGVTLTIRVIGAPVPKDPDLTGDGVVGAHDLLYLLSAWGTPCGDLNGDGTTGASDLLILLDHWM